MERLANAVESLLLCSELPKGLQSAFISILPLNPTDFPTGELRTLFSEIMQRHQNERKHYNKTNSAPRSLALSYLPYATIPGRSKHWFKQQIWKLFRRSLTHNEIYGP